jgi:hypothetical protein
MLIPELIPHFFLVRKAQLCTCTLRFLIDGSDRNCNCIFQRVFLRSKLQLCKNCTNGLYRTVFFLDVRYWQALDVFACERGHLVRRFFCGKSCENKARCRLALELLGKSMVVLSQ